MVRRRKDDVPHRFSLTPAAALAVGAGLLVTIVTTAPQGAARDWDINAAAGALVGLATCHAIATLSRRVASGRAWALATSVAFALVVVLWSVTTDAGSQLSRITGMLDARPAWTGEQHARALDFLGWQAFNRRSFDEAGSDFERAATIAPNPRYFYQAGLARWRARRLTEASRLERIAARLAPANGDPWWVITAAARALGDSAQSAACVDSARARGSVRRPMGL